MDLTEFYGARLDQWEAAVAMSNSAPADANRFMDVDRWGEQLTWLVNEDTVSRLVDAGRKLLALHEVHSEPGRWGDGPRRGQPTGKTSYWCETCDHDRDYGHIGGPDEGCETLRVAVAVWSDHPDYDEAWRP
jgi:hypothetical protein